jgi:hypothetical protein
MNEGSKFLALELAILAEFLHRVQLLVDPRKKMAWMFEFPKKRIENLMEQWKKGLALPLAMHEYFQIVESASRRVEREVVRSRKENSLQAQARARFRSEEFESKSEDQIEREALRWVNDCWNEAVEHQATI